ncbi:MAG: serine/threonine protein kinase, partial [Myxococcales bacterium]|nr:serine/threonine protein kinase [Myxococcales bacterium]
MTGTGERDLPEETSPGGEVDERLPTKMVRPPGVADDLETVRPPGPVAPGPAVAPTDLMDGQTMGEQTLSDMPPVNPFAGLLAEAQGKPVGKKASQTLVVRAKNGGSTASVPPAPAPAPAPTPAPPLVSEPEADTLDNTDGGRREVGPYRIISELGSGGMAVVYKATQPALDRLVAIKELRKEYVHDRQIATRFEREATSLATLQHGNIVHVYDFIKARDAAFIVMEFVDGIDLFDVLAHTERFPADIAALVALQVAEGLEYAHYRGIVHRDIKPSNILISRRGEVKIMDFGIARDPGKSELTQVGLAVGTPAYMAPEQIRGDKVDFRTDLFALGIVLYEMLAGEKPWPEEKGRSVTVKVLDEPAIPLAKVCPSAPAELQAIVERCLMKDPAQRYRSTFEVRRDLERYCQSATGIDPRGRLVLFLKNRGFVTEAEARTFVEPRLLADRLIERGDAGIAPPPPVLLLKPVGMAHAVGLAVILLAGLLAWLLPFGDPVPAVASAAELRIEEEVARRLAEQPPAPATAEAPGAPRLAEAPVAPDG